MHFLTTSITLQGVTSSLSGPFWRTLILLDNFKERKAICPQICATIYHHTLHFLYILQLWTQCHRDPNSHCRLFAYIPSTVLELWPEPANHNICYVAVTTGLILPSAQSVHIELTGFSCSEGMSTQERTNQSYFTSGTPGLNHNLPSCSLPPTAPSFFAFLGSLEPTMRAMLNESDKLFTWTIMSRSTLRGTTISTFH